MFQPFGSLLQRYRSLVVSTASGTGDRPISVDDAKEHIRVIDDTADDTYIGTLIDSATTWAENYCDRTFADKAYTVAFDDFYGLRIELPRPPVRLNATAASATVTISYVDTSGNTQTLTWAESGTQDFRLDKDHTPALVYPVYQATWPSVRLDDKAVQITYLAGYGGSTYVPAPVKHCLKLIVGLWYANREMVGTVPQGIAMMLDQYRWRPYV
jgi:uncharacterized phiE125 gp8 family phage protein